MYFLLFPAVRGFVSAESCAELVNVGTVVRRRLRAAVGRALVAGCRTLAAVVLVSVGGAPDP